MAYMHRARGLAYQEPGMSGFFDWLKERLTPPRAVRQAFAQSVQQQVGAALKVQPEPAPRTPGQYIAAAGEGISSAVESVPGGWLTIAAVGVGAFLLLRRRR